MHNITPMHHNYKGLKYASVPLLSLLINVGLLPREKPEKILIRQTVLC